MLSLPHSNVGEV